MFGNHLKRPAPADLEPVDRLPRYEMHRVLKATVERLFERSKRLRREAEEIEREAGTVLAIVDQERVGESPPLPCPR